MTPYQPPLRDYEFLATAFLALPETVFSLPKYKEVSLDDLRAVVSEAGRFASERVAPINLSTDQEGCRLTDGAVFVPEKMRIAITEYLEGGWLGLLAESGDGGQGLPEVIGFMVNEMMSAASISFGDYAGLFANGYKMARSFLPESLKARYMDGLATGAIASTQCMTEPHCGSDIGLLRTRAEPAADGTYCISGSKIFISGGDHDLTDNILHFVLARIPGAPAGVKGVSLFLVPKILPDGSRNAVAPIGLEHKMGYSASATCQLKFDKATGWLISEPGQGLVAMFEMVNAARLLVGAQGLCTAGAGYQIAAAYARERLQGRSLTGPRFPELEADPLIVHPDVRRMLLSVRSFVEAARALYLWMAVEVDRARHHPDAEEREISGDWLDLLTGPVKAVMSDMGFAATNDCVQILGGHGYIRDNGVEILVRDCRLAQIQEGANGLLAANLIRRQLALNGGRGYTRFIAAMRSTQRACEARSALASVAAGLSTAIDWLEEGTAWVLDAAERDREEIGAAAVDYQWIFGLALFAWIWARLAIAALDQMERESRDEGDFLKGKLALARFFMDRTLPAAAAHLAKLKTGASSITAPAQDWF